MQFATRGTDAMNWSGANCEASSYKQNEIVGSTADRLAILTAGAPFHIDIDRDDHLARRLACQGDPEPFHIEETDTSFAIDWKGHYRIPGQAFILHRSQNWPHHNRARLPHRQARVTPKISNIFG